jgi:hypothetical protein
MSFYSNLIQQGSRLRPDQRERVGLSSQHRNKPDSDILSDAMPEAHWVSLIPWSHSEFSRRHPVPYAVITVTKGLRYRCVEITFPPDTHC